MRNLLAIAFAACVVPGAALAVDDSQYYTLYTRGDSPNTLTWAVCTGGSCFATGEIGPFKNVCAVLDGRPKVQGNVETRAVYVVDKLRHPSSATLHLFVYTRTDTFSSGGDDVEFVQSADLDTHIASHGLGDERCLMAGNEQVVFVGLSNGSYVIVDKHTLAVSPAEDQVSFMSADNNGYVTLGTVNGEFLTYDNDGNPVQRGSAPRFTTDTRNAFIIP